MAAEAMKDIDDEEDDEGEDDDELLVSFCLLNSFDPLKKFLWIKNVLLFLKLECTVNGNVRINMLFK